MNKAVPLGIGIAIITIAVLTFSLSNQSLEDLETSVDVEPELDVSIQQTGTTTISSECLGTANCITGTVTTVIDGDTLEVDGQVVRFALVGLKNPANTQSLDHTQPGQTIPPSF